MKIEVVHFKKPVVHRLFFALPLEAGRDLLRYNVKNSASGPK